MTTRSRPRTSGLLALVVAAATGLAGCGSDADSSATAPATETSASSTPASSTPASSTPASSTAASSTGAPVDRTPELDAIGVIGHSGATGADSNGDGRDVPENSWATGTNPEVDSIYRRLLADHPALEGHGWNEAVDGSGVDSLMHQAQALLSHQPVPDIVLVNSIDNDIQCNGNDEDNYDAFEAGLDEVLTYLETSAPGIEVFFVDQWTSVTAYDDVAAGIPDLVNDLSGTGVCSAFEPDGTRDTEAEAYLQQQVDAYFERIVRVCATHTGCATDEGAMQTMPLEAGDLTSDFNHLKVSGLAKEAAIAWQKLPTDWKT